MGEEMPSDKRDSVPRAISIGIFIAIATAAVGYIVTLMDDHRKRQIEFADRQIEKLYGPLLSLSVANQRAWSELHYNFRNKKTYYFDDNDKPTPQQVEIWRRWMKTVFLPLDIKMETAIIDNAQLIDGGHIYTVFQDLIAHVESYKATIAKWKEIDEKENPHFRDTAENTAVIQYPVTLAGCIQQRFELVKIKRDALENSWVPYLRNPPNDYFLPADCR
jgi:hypothetical protein